jgi:anthranilate synthase component II
MSRLLLIDNYDSFTYNLYQYLCELGADVEVRRNDFVTVEEIEGMEIDGIILSPGPGRPQDAGVCIPVIQRFAGQLPILGVCLGHQAIAAAYGAQIVGASELLHGKTSQIVHAGDGLYQRMKPNFTAVRYHSLVADRATLPATLLVDSETADGTIMGLRHREIPLYGVQFHPESILTDGGKILLQNFLDVVVAHAAEREPVASTIPAGR